MKKEIIKESIVVKSTEYYCDTCGKQLHKNVNYRECYLCKGDFCIDCSYLVATEKEPYDEYFDEYAHIILCIKCHTPYVETVNEIVQLETKIEDLESRKEMTIQARWEDIQSKKKGVSRET